MNTGKSKNATDAAAMKVGQVQTKEISTEGEARVVKESSIDIIKGDDLGSRVEMDKFMNEELEVLLYQPMNRGEEKVVQLGVNGVNQFIPRGIKQKVKRKYVEVLARSRNMNVSAEGFKLENGETKNVVRIAGGLQYPFQVIKDPNPKGPEWLGKILAEA